MDDDSKIFGWSTAVEPFLRWLSMRATAILCFAAWWWRLALQFTPMAKGSSHDGCKIVIQCAWTTRSKKILKCWIRTVCWPPSKAYMFWLNVLAPVNMFFAFCNLDASCLETSLLNACAASNMWPALVIAPMSHDERSLSKRSLRDWGEARIGCVWTTRCTKHIRD